MKGKPLTGAAPADSSALSELKIMPEPVVVRIAQDVEQPRVGGNHQPSEPAFCGVAEGRPPSGAAIWGRGRDPAFGLVRSGRVLERLDLPGNAREDRQAGGDGS